MDETKNYDALPEKKKDGEEKTAGMFFQKRAQPRAGRFFRDMAGRDDGNFYNKVAASTMSVQVGPKNSKIKTESVRTSPTGVPQGMNSAPGGQETSTGINGTGEGLVNKEAEPQTEEERLKAILARAAGGKERSATEAKKEDEEKEEDEKTASLAPSDGDENIALPTGFHRPAYEQPEALEPGGERFHSTEVTNPSFMGEKKAMTPDRRTLFENKLKNKNQVQGAKHASRSMRFMGTKYAASYEGAKEVAERAGSDYSQAMRNLQAKGEEKLQKGIKWVTDPKHPERAGIGTAGAALLALMAARRGFRGAKGLASKAVGRSQSPGVVQRLKDAASSMVR